MREYDEDDYNTRRYAPVLRRVIILVAVIIAVPVMMWTITIFIRSYVKPPIRHLTLTEPLLTASLPPKPQAAERAPAPLPTDAARTAGDGLPSLPEPPAETAPNAPAVASGEAAAVTDSAATAETASSETITPEAIRGGLTSLPDPPAETAPNAPAVASGEAAAVTDSAQSAATAETASSETVTPVQRDRLTPTGPATESIVPVGPVPLPRARPVDAPVDSPPSGSPLLARPAAYGWPGLDSVH
jgi:hypothetical protein